MQLHHFSCKGEGHARGAVKQTPDANRNSKRLEPKTAYRTGHITPKHHRSTIYHIHQPGPVEQFQNFFVAF
ncbi:hypothetical protein FTO70_15530 [Methanosarcina sp. KYL-1]|uniref:hypothetical protein n=1 Tax=Methanosarcina sp. KYL-1 TaxID=2602068 RepID=UPI002100AD20|nr:hypothetical protein [Methanosarcina sp. KYL-1]MCQ1537056.1 hypothetical protein [Methanosarcina sp. KYL-1]